MQKYRRGLKMTRPKDCRPYFSTRVSQNSARKVSNRGSSTNLGKHENDVNTLTVDNHSIVVQQRAGRCMRTWGRYFSLFQTRFGRGEQSVDDGRSPGTRSCELLGQNPICMYRSHSSTAIVAKEVELVIESAESGSNFLHSFANRFHEQQDVRL
jgi:hypothetical protein